MKNSAYKIKDIYSIDYVCFVNGFEISLQYLQGENNQNGYFPWISITGISFTSSQIDEGITVLWIKK